jgi:beta-lactamase class D
MGRLTGLLGALFVALAVPAAAEQRVACMVAVDLGASEPLIQDGDCDERISPASTFKIAISLMGFDSGVLISPDQPAWPFREGYADWIPEWRQTTTPRTWMRDSVVWFSRRTTEELGKERFAAYVKAFGYGNQDVSGDKGKANGLTSAWLSSSLQISPVEQVAFITRMIEGDLPVKRTAVERTRQLLELAEQPNGWRVYGKTGSGTPFDKDGNLLKGQPFGWYVGWAEKDGRTVVFARLLRFSERPDTRSGFLARDGLLQALFAEGGRLD